MYWYKEGGLDKFNMIFCIVFFIYIIELWFLFSRLLVLIVIVFKGEVL